MTGSRLVRHAMVLAVVAVGRAEAQFPKERDKDFEAKLKAAVAAVKPLPEVPIPDDPPPHEGAMIDIPYVVEPPDLLLVEVLEALPGKPITGERLVSPDGTMNLGFYGTVHIRGLTLGQIKIKVVEHLRQSLPDSVLGLVKEVATDPPPLPRPGVAPFELEERKEPEPATRPKTSSTGTARDRYFGRRTPNPNRVVVSEPEFDEEPGLTATPPEIRAVRGPKKGQRQPDAEMPMTGPDDFVKYVPVAPEDSDCVFVDVAAYNSKYYYVLGDFAVPGRLPWTGNETVLEAVNYAGGFIPSADRSDIRLVRPAHGGKPMKVYRIDYEAIAERGDKAQNYQVFPGDRIIVGRNKLVQSTIQVDRLAATLQQVTNSLLQASLMTRSLVQATPELTPAQREALVKDWIEIVWKQSNQPGGPTPDEKTFRELLIRQLRSAPQPVPTPEKK